MTDEIDYKKDSLFPTRGLIPEVDNIRDRRITESVDECACTSLDSCTYDEDLFDSDYQ